MIEVEGSHNTVAGRDLITISAGDGLVRQVFGDQILPTTLTWQRERFAEPAGFREAVEFLRFHKFLPLTATSGLRTAALCLLHDVHREARTVEHVEVEHDTELRLRRVPEDALVLIDFRTAEDTRPVEAQLSGFITNQVPYGHVVVLLSGNESEEFLARYGHLRRNLPKPQPEEVLRAHLRHDLSEDRIDALTGNPDWRELAEGAGPADVAHFAELVVRAWHDAPQGDPVRDAFEAFHKYAKTLKEQFDARTAKERSVLLALALVNDGRHESIYRAERILLDPTDHQEEPCQVLASEGFLSRLAKIANTTTSLDRTKFTRRDYDTSVLNHVWRGYPQLRDHLSDWITKVVVDDQAHLEPKARKEIAARLLVLCTDTGDAKPLLAAVQKWAGSNAGLAAGLLDEAAVDEHTKVQVRRRMYSWVKNPELSPQLARTVIEACKAQFGAQYPQFALTRLGHLTGHFQEAVVRKVEEALLVLAARHPEVVLARMTEWLRRSTDNQWAAAAFVVREVTLPGNGFRLRDDSGVTAWRAVLGSSTNHLGVVRGLSDWFSAAAAVDRATRIAAFDLVLDAAGDDTSALNLLGMSVDRWKRDQPEGREEVHDELRGRIDDRHPVVRG